MGRVYCTSDWHGCWNVAKKIVDFLQPDDTLYFLGDFCDRGKESSQILDLLLTDRRIKWIRGNHDQMFIDYMPEVLESMTVPSLWANNGCYNTILSFGRISPQDVMINIKKMENLPFQMEYTSPAGHNIIMEHAGYTPFGIPKHGHDPLWERSHFHDKWTYKPSSSEPWKNTYLVHGHTPVQYLKYMYGYYEQPVLTIEEAKDKRNWMKGNFEEIKNKPTIIRYCEGHKFDIDMCTIVSNRVALLNLDTFEEIYFDAEDNN